MVKVNGQWIPWDHQTLFCYFLFKTIRRTV